MKHRGRFTKIGKNKKRMYGPRGLLVCGYPEEERTGFRDLADKAGLGDIRIVFATSRDLEIGTGDILRRENRPGAKGDSDIPRAVVMSGLTQNELHRLMAAYKESGRSRQIWATLTPFSEEWTLKHLLRELRAEEGAMKKGPSNSHST